MRAVATDMLVRRHILPSTSTPVHSRVQPALTLNRGATFSGYDSNLRPNTRGRVDAVDVSGCRSSAGSKRTILCSNAAANSSVIQFSPDKQHCSTPAGRGRCMPAASTGFHLRNELSSDASFCNKSQCSTRVTRHASINGSSIACFDDRPRKPEKSSGSFLSASGLGFLQKLSRGSARSGSPDRCRNADVSTTSVKRRSSIRDSFKRMFRSHRFG